MSNAEGSDISVNDVYKIGQDIAEEFDLLVQHYGIDNIRSLVEKVIAVLEMLESTVKQIECLEIELADTLATNLHLSSLKNISDQERSQLKQSFEEAEDSWVQELTALKTRISSLKTENELLRSDLFVKKEISFTSVETLKNVVEDRDIAIRKLECSLKQKEKQLQDLSFNGNYLNCKVKELVEKNKNLHSQNQVAKTDITRLIMEKNDCKSELVLLKKENALLTENICELVCCTFIKQEDSDKSLECDPYSKYSCEESLRRDIKQHIKTEMKLLEKVKKLQYELQLERCKSQKYQEELLKTCVDENKQHFQDSKIHQFFHLFLGVTSVSKFFWL